MYVYYMTCKDHYSLGNKQHLFLQLVIKYCKPLKCVLFLLATLSVHIHFTQYVFINAFIGISAVHLLPPSKVSDQYMYR